MQCEEHFWGAKKCTLPGAGSTGDGTGDGTGEAWIGQPAIED